jgi:copper chaperone CopZ
MSDQVLSTFQVNGMHCAACQKLIQKRITSAFPHAHVQKLEIDGTLEIVSPQEISTADLANALVGTPYSL